MIKGVLVGFGIMVLLALIPIASSDFRIWMGQGLLQGRKSLCHISISQGLRCARLVLPSRGRSTSPSMGFYDFSLALPLLGFGRSPQRIFIRTLIE